MSRRAPSTPPPPRHSIGIDLSGPTNVRDTAFAVIACTPQGRRLESLRAAASDPDLLESVAAFPDAVVGLDAPLSYKPGGGQRAADAALRARLVNEGLPGNSVMAPTMQRMVYLTLRGVCVARMLAALGMSPGIVEVHPTAALLLRGARLEDVRRFKADRAARRALCRWLEDRHVRGIGTLEPSDHELAAVAAAIAAADWSAGAPAWLHPADPPHHPYDFAA